LGLAIPDDAGTFVILPVELNAGCDCTIANVAIAIGINHPFVQDLRMNLFSPDNNGVLLVSFPPSNANLVPGNKITFDDSVDGALNPQILGANIDGSGNILAGTYFAEGDTSGEVNDDGLGLFKGKTAAGDWRFGVGDFAFGNTGTIQSVELTIECAE